MQKYAIEGAKTNIQKVKSNMAGVPGRRFRCRHDGQAVDRQAADWQAADQQAADRQAADWQAADRQAADRQAAKGQPGKPAGKVVRKRKLW